MRRHMRMLQRHGEDLYIIDEARPFRFGGGPRVMSTHAVIMPMQIQGAGKVARLRVSVVDQEIPLLLSKSTLKALGMVMDLDKGRIVFREMQTEVPLRETKAGLCGFTINTKPSGRRRDSPPEQLLNEENEIVIEECKSEEPGLPIEPTDGPRHVQQSGAKKKPADYTINKITPMKLSRDWSGCFRSATKRHRDIHGGEGRANEAWVAGVYPHGAWTGVTKRTLRYPNVVRYVNMFMRSRVDGEWSSFTLMKNVSTDVHVDRHNDREATATTVTFGDFKGGQLWIAEEVTDPISTVEVCLETGQGRPMDSRATT